MKTCAKCQSTFDDAVKFCRKCGTTLSAPEIEHPSVKARRELFESRIAAEPGSVKPVLEYAEYLRGIDRITEALEQIDRAAKSTPANRDLRRTMASMLAGVGRWDDAVVHLLVLAESSPTDIALLLEITDAYMRGGRMDEAHETLVRAVAITSSDLPLLDRLAAVLLAAGLKEKFCTVAGRVVTINPDSDLLPRLAQVLAELGNNQEAARAWNGVLRKQPDNDRAHLFLGLHGFESSEGDRMPDGTTIRHLEHVAAHADRYDPDERSQALCRYAYVLASRPGFDPDSVQAVLAGVHPPALGPKDRERFMNVAMAVAARIRDNDMFRAARLLGWARQCGASNELKAALADVSRRFARAAFDSGDFEHAIEHGQASLGDQFDAETAQLVSNGYVALGDSLRAHDKTAALAAYRNAMEMDQRADGAIGQRIRSIRMASIRHRIAVVLLILTVVAGAAAGIYVSINGKSVLKITAPHSSIVILHNETGREVWRVANYKGESWPVWWGKYTIKGIPSEDPYKETQMNIDVAFGREPKEFWLDMKTWKGKVKADSDPTGAKLTVHSNVGDYSCVTPCEIDADATESTIALSKDGFATWQVTKRVQHDETIDLGVVPLTGSVNISTDVPGADVYLIKARDFACVTPCLLERVPGGDYTLMIRKSGHINQTIQIRIEGGKVVELDNVHLVSFKEERERLAAEKLAALQQVVYLDRANGLMWQLGDSGMNRYHKYESDTDKAVAYCADLRLGGFADWRIPQYHESASLLRGAEFQDWGMECQGEYPSARRGQGPGANGCFLPGEFTDCADNFLVWSDNLSEWAVKNRFMNEINYGIAAHHCGSPRSDNYRIRCVRALKQSDLDI